MSKPKAAFVSFLVVSLVSAGAALAALRAHAGQEPGAVQKAETLEALLKQRRDFAKEMFDAHRKGALARRNTIDRLREQIGPSGTGDRNLILDMHIGNLEATSAQDQVYRWAQRLLTTEVDISDTLVGRVAAYEGHLLRMKELETAFKQHPEAKYHRLEAEVLLQRAKGR